MHVEVQARAVRVFGIKDRQRSGEFVVVVCHHRNRSAVLVDEFAAVNTSTRDPVDREADTRISEGLIRDVRFDHVVVDDVCALVVITTNIARCLGGGVHLDHVGVLVDVGHYLRLSHDLGDRNTVETFLDSELNVASRDRRVIGKGHPSVGFDAGNNTDKRIIGGIHRTSHVNLAHKLRPRTRDRVTRGIEVHCSREIGDRDVDLVEIVVGNRRLSAVVETVIVVPDPHLRTAFGGLEGVGVQVFVRQRRILELNVGNGVGLEIRPIDREFQVLVLVCRPRTGVLTLEEHAVVRLLRDRDLLTRDIVTHLGNPDSVLRRIREEYDGVLGSVLKVHGAFKFKRCRRIVAPFLNHHALVVFERDLVHRKVDVLGALRDRPKGKDLRARVAVLDRSNLECHGEVVILAGKVDIDLRDEATAVGIHAERFRQRVLVDRRHRGFRPRVRDRSVLRHRGLGDLSVADGVDRALTGVNHTHGGVRRFTRRLGVVLVVVPVVEKREHPFTTTELQASGGARVLQASVLDFVTIWNPVHKEQLARKVRHKWRVDVVVVRFSRDHPTNRLRDATCDHVVGAERAHIRVRQQVAIVVVVLTINGRSLDRLDIDDVEVVLARVTVVGSTHDDGGKITCRAFGV